MYYKYRIIHTNIGNSLDDWLREYYSKHGFHPPFLVMTKETFRYWISYNSKYYSIGNKMFSGIPAVFRNKWGGENLRKFDIIAPNGEDVIFVNLH